MINEYNAKRFCCEPIENIENYAEAIADETQVWDIHHRGEILPCGVYSAKTLKKFGLYYHRPAAELIFMTRSQHTSLHNKADKRGKIAMAKRTSEQQSKYGRIGGKIAGKISGPKNVKIMRAKLTREHLSKGGKKMLGKHWWNDGSIETEAFECPGPGWVRGRLRKAKEGYAIDS